MGWLLVSRWWEELLHAVTGRANRHVDLPDLRDLPSRRVAVERTHYLVNDRERQSRDDRLYVLRREPASRRDASAVAVFSNGRNVGYLPVGAASAVAPSLDRIGGAAVVNGVGSKTGSIRLWVELPTNEAIEEYALDHREGPANL